MTQAAGSPGALLSQGRQTHWGGGACRGDRVVKTANSQEGAPATECHGPRCTVQSHRALLGAAGGCRYSGGGGSTASTRRGRRLPPSVLARAAGVTVDTTQSSP